MSYTLDGASASDLDFRASIDSEYVQTAKRGNSVKKARILSRVEVLEGEIKAVTISIQKNAKLQFLFEEEYNETELNHEKTKERYDSTKDDLREETRRVHVKCSNIDRIAKNLVTEINTINFAGSSKVYTINHERYFVQVLKGEMVKINHY